MTAEHGSSLRTYFVVYFWLLVLMVATVAASYVHTGAFHIWIALGIATVKSVLIVMYFMHAKFSSRWVAIFFASSLYMLGAGFLLLFADYWFRT